MKFAEDTQSRRASKTDHASDAAHPRPRGDLDLYLKRKVYQEEFASDLPRRTSAVLYATQRPAAVGGFAETATAAAWKTIPSWYLIGTRDSVIPPDRQRFMAERAGARTVEITASHVSLISHAGAVTALIVAAARTVR